MNVVWFLLEWCGVFFALSAAYLMSKNSGQEKEAWSLFLLADSMHAIFYMHTGQTGLVYNQAIGFFLAIIGLILHCKNENKVLVYFVNKLTNLLLFIFGILSVYFSLKWMFKMTFENLEWMAAFISLTGTAIMASKNKYSKYGFFAWMFCDISMLYVALIKGQLGITLLRVIYLMIDINGIRKFFEKLSILNPFRMKKKNVIFEIN